MNLGDFSRWFAVQPFTTKYLVLLSILIPIAIRLYYPVLLHVLVFDSSAWKRLQLWRFVSNYFVALPTTINYLMSLLLRGKYSLYLESAMSPSDYLTFILFAMLSLNVVNIFILGLPVMWDALSMAIVYVWSRRFAEQKVSFWGGFAFPARYLPLVLLLWDALLRGQWVEGLLGILVGHLYWFAREEYDAIKTPAVIKAFFRDQRRSLLRQEEGLYNAHPRRGDDRGERGVFRGHSYRLGE